MSLHEYQERVIEEKDALNVKITALRAFIMSDDYDALSNEVRTLLARQLVYMIGYSEILQDRINLF